MGDKDHKKLLTPNDVAEQLGLSLTSVYDLLRSGKLRSKRIGPKGWLYRVTREQLQDYLDSTEFHVPDAPVRPQRRQPRISPEGLAAIKRFGLS